jgi:hypothetical protein
VKDRETRRFWCTQQLSNLKQLIALVAAEEQLRGDSSSSSSSNHCLQISSKQQHWQQERPQHSALGRWCTMDDVVLAWQRLPRRDKLKVLAAGTLCIWALGLSVSAQLAATTKL